MSNDKIDFYKYRRLSVYIEINCESYVTFSNNNNNKIIIKNLKLVEYDIKKFH